MLYLHVCLLSNLAIVDIKLEKYHQAYIYSSEGLKLLRTIKKKVILNKIFIIHT